MTDFILGKSDCGRTLKERMRDRPKLPQKPRATGRVPVQRSYVGDRLKTIFTKRVGAIPCGWCRDEMTKLNQMTPEEIRADRTNIVNRITRNAMNAKKAWWAKLALIVDQSLHLGGAEIVIGMWLDEAINAE